ncbi:MAG: YigZ family protein [Candidatus Marinimicrobia bacterium]|jgi:uncharacterized YigZ family protein|nr:YigZ family protein [Candidatus Neomarinimicrobiota bacterium]MBT3502436.1 YigZ family protein [Candidatus Neomarinimicrobiota bacterium]MBT3838766.1 YigZ family protein [Candidatus Neomarinimicrobiota bacterium]MBT3999660.1 YigZ family protein [Candidatus Neomarinimicrobiota bacterium]MBT4578775.1 YigZ family protein [Candidatus Neomarinimicrobiota bacterium]
MSLVSPKHSQFHTFKEQQSKFISRLSYFDDVTNFKLWLSGLRKEYYDASHVCWGYRIFVQNQLEENSSDSGEPSGTAGFPIINTLKQKQVVNCGLAVIRYFGGIKLGKRGLIDAYSQSAQLVIDKTDFVKWMKKDKYFITSPMAFYGNLSQSISRLGGIIRDNQSDDNLKWIIEIDSNKLNELIKLVRTVTKGTGDLEKL